MRGLILSSTCALASVFAFSAASAQSVAATGHPVADPLHWNGGAWEAACSSSSECDYLWHQHMKQCHYSNPPDLAWCRGVGGPAFHGRTVMTPMLYLMGFFGLGLSAGGALGASVEASKTEDQKAADAAQGKPDAITQGMVYGGGAGLVIGGMIALGMTLKSRHPIAGASWWNNARFFFFRGRTGVSRVGVSW